jgi:MFS family permease
MLPESPMKLYRETGYLNVWLSQVLSLLGSQVSLVALPLVVLSQLHSAADVGLVTVSEAVAMLGVTVGLGPWISRLGHKALMMTCDIVRGLAMVMLTWLSWTHHLSLAVVLAAAVVNSALSIAFSSANFAVLGLILPREARTAALSWNQGRFALLSVAGPLVGGACYAVAPSLPFAIDAVSFLVSAACVTALRLPTDHDRQAGARRPRGLRRRSTGFLRYMMLNTAVTNFAVSGAILTLTAFYAGHGRGPQTGVILAAGGLANLVGALCAAPLARVASTRAIVVTVAALTAISFLLLPLVMSQLPLVCVLVGVCCIGSPVVAVLTQARLLADHPAGAAGQAQAWFLVVPQLVSALGPLAAAQLLSRFPPGRVVLIFGCLLACFALFSAAALGRLRAFDATAAGSLGT